MEKLGKVLNIISAAALIFVVAATLGDVLASGLLDSPFAGIYDLVQIGMGICVFLALPAVFLADSNIRVDIIDIFAPRPVVRFLQITGLLASLAFLSILLWSTLLQGLDALQFRSIFFEIGVSHFAVWGPIIASTLLSIVCVCIVLIRTLATTDKEERQ